MTRRGKASERRRGIGEGERQLVMAQLVARWRRSNLVILVALRKGNHPGEACEKGLKKSFVQKREGLLRGAS